MFRDLIKTRSGNNIPFGLSAYTLKVFSFICMLVDHTAIALVNPDVDPMLYAVMRGLSKLGTFAFFFFIAEGAIYTRDRRRYLLKLFSLAVLCELPYDYFMGGRFPYWESQNAVFTFCLGLCGIIGTEKAFKLKEVDWRRTLLASGCCIVPLSLAWMLHTDWGLPGIFMIYGFYVRQKYYRESGLFLIGMAISMIFLWLSEPMSLIVPFGFVFAYLYNGQRGRRLPASFFYAGFFLQNCFFAIITMLVH